MSIISCRDRLTSQSSGQRLNKLILCRPSPALVTSQHLCICLRIFPAAVSSSTSIASIWNTPSNTEPASNTACHLSCSQKLNLNNAMDLVYIRRPSPPRMPLLDIPQRQPVPPALSYCITHLAPHTRLKALHTSKACPASSYSLTHPAPYTRLKTWETWIKAKARPTPSRHCRYWHHISTSKPRIFRQRKAKRFSDTRSSLQTLAPTIHRETSNTLGGKTSSPRPTLGSCYKHSHHIHLET